MPPEVQTNPGPAVKDLAETYTGTIEDDAIDAKEWEQIEVKAKQIRDFLSGGSVPRQFNSPEDLEQRERALTQAVEEVVKQYPSLTAVDTYELISPDNPKRTLKATGEDFWRNFDELNKVYPKDIMRAKLLKEADDKPNEFFKNLKKIPDSYLGKSFWFDMLKTGAVLPSFCFKKWENETYAEELCLTIFEISYFEDARLFQNIRRKAYAERVMLKVAESDPELVLALYLGYKQLPYADKLLEAVVKNCLKLADTFPKVESRQSQVAEYLTAIIGNYHLFQDKPYAQEVMEAIRLRIESEFQEGDNFRESLKVDMQSAADYTGYFKCKDINERAAYLQKLATKINPNFEAELQAFNEKNNISLRLMGMRNDHPPRFIFVNTWGNSKDEFKLPIRIQITAAGIRLLNEELPRVLKYQGVSAEQTEVWRKREYAFDIPKEGKTAFMLAAVPDNLMGIETDSARISQILRQQYGAKWQSVLMENQKEWSALAPGLGKNVPEAIEPTAENIVRQFEKGLKIAIDEGRERFVFYYIMHGGEQGTVQAVDFEFEVDMLADVLAEPYKGRPIGSQIEVDIFAESCYSGSQLNIIIHNLERETVPVKGLRIITAASSKTIASGGLKPDKASLIGGEMLDDPSGAMTYYISYYFEMMDYLRSQGQSIHPPVGTMGHAIAFADRMARDDSDVKQDLQAYYYSTENPVLGPGPVKEITPPTPAKPAQGGGGNLGAPHEGEKSTGSEKKTPDETPNGYYFSKRQSGNQDAAFS